MRRLIIYIILAIIVMFFISKVTIIFRENLNADNEKKNSIRIINKNDKIVTQLGAMSSYCPEFDYKSLRTAEQKINIETVCTNKTREKGLSDREALASSTGMFFIFENPAVQNFWMKDMKFSIDIVWINEDFRVVGIIHDAKPESYPELFSSPEPVKYVLELNSGDAEKFGLEKGLALIPSK